MFYNFMNDYNELGHERIIEAITRVNREQDAPYGLDSHSDAARALIMGRLDHPQSEVHFLTGGTQTNLTFIAAALRAHQGVIAANTGHINVHESGAIEATGHKVLQIPTSNGKITAAEIEALASAHYADATAEHMVQPGMVYLSNPTEVGTIYTRDELDAIHEVCQTYHMPLYVDGARLGCALACPENDVTLSDLARLTSAFYIGGTKMGAMLGEALVINEPELARDFRYMIKQRGGMLAKGRLVGLQFETLFCDDLYFELARHALQQAARLRDGLRALGYERFVESPTNQIFPILPREKIAQLDGTFGYSFWQRYDQTRDVVRFCTSWATPPEAVDALLAALK